MKQNVYQVCIFESTNRSLYFKTQSIDFVLHKICLFQKKADVEESKKTQIKLLSAVSSLEVLRNNVSSLRSLGMNHLFELLYDKFSHF